MYGKAGIIMGIQYFEEERIFRLCTKNTMYLIGIVDEEGFIAHIYYGKNFSDYHLLHLTRIEEAPFVPSKNDRDRLSFLDTFPMEYSTQGIGDFRESSLMARTENGHRACTLSYQSHQILKGKPHLKGLPATFGNEDTCETLEITCYDCILNLEVVLSYSVFHDVDAITRSVRLKNVGEDSLYIEKVYSVCMDMDNDEFDMLTLHGSWARERHIQRRAIRLGKQSVGSIRGESSHQEHPFVAILSKNATQDIGEVYGFHFVYSGNFLAQVELNQFDSIRATLGIHPEGFTWKLNSGDEFVAPEVAMVYSEHGLGGMTRNYHDLYRKHLIRSTYKNKKRPILINNWEATYFDFNTEKLVAIAEEAVNLGIEMLVMDDGWFGKRNSDNCSLGDWVVNEEKIKGGLNQLVKQVNKKGLEFGIWFEPEMVSPDSDLYRAHPDWAIQIPNRVAGLCRNQYVLDVSRKEVRDYVFESVANILRSANIRYVKWDMNRQLSDLGSFALEKDEQGELYHRYVLGVYELQERLLKEFPYLLLENCSGGGARFDPGMLYYSPQIWCSDDTDAIERLAIQEGTALLYPLSTIGAHVSDCPNHTVGRVTPFETRGYVALAGTFGYELDVLRIPKEDKEMIPSQVAMYHKYNDLVREGDYYRIASYQENNEFDCWQVVSKDKKETLVTYIQVLRKPNYHSCKIKLKGLNETKWYYLEETNERYYGSTLMHAGILVQNMWGDFKGKLLHFIEET